MAATSIVTRLPVQGSLLLISFASSFAAIVLAYRLWGGWVAAFFAVLNFDWMQRSFLGGAEPLAVALIFGALVLVRKDRYVLASFLAALSTVVRPLGICCLIGIGAVLLFRREYQKLACAVLIGAAVGTLYVLPLATHFGDALATVHSYEGAQVPLFGIPFYAIVKGTILYPAP
jgi:Gpi18-like mannosyltransferase